MSITRSYRICTVWCSTEFSNNHSLAILCLSSIRGNRNLKTCHDFRRNRSLSLFGRYSAVDVTDLLAITDPFFIGFVFLHTWFQSHQLHVVYLTLCFPSRPCRRLFVCMFVGYVLVRDGVLYPLLFIMYFGFGVLLRAIKLLHLYQVWFSCAWLPFPNVHKNIWMSDGTERHRQDAVDGIEYSIYIQYEMSNVGYVNIILSSIV